MIFWAWQPTERKHIAQQMLPSSTDASDNKKLSLDGSERHTRVSKQVRSFELTRGPRPIARFTEFKSVQFIQINSIHFEFISNSFLIPSFHFKFIKFFSIHVWFIFDLYLILS